MNRAALLAEIDAAFPLLPRPNTTLRQATLMDQGLSREISQEEWDAAGARDRDLSWQDLSSEALIECSNGVAHLDEAAFVYYLPAFLRFTVNHLPDDLPLPSPDLITTVVFSLTHCSIYNLARLKRLSGLQIDVVISFLQFVAEHSRWHRDEIAEALAAYWQTPESRRPTLIHVP